MNAIDISKLWARNKSVRDEWMRDYASRTGLSREEIVAEVQMHWIHDERAKSVCLLRGYELVACPHEGKWRYTVKTPWGMCEGLCDTPERDDRYAKGLLGDVMLLMKGV